MTIHEDATPSDRTPREEGRRPLTLLTGATGYVGGRLLPRLLADGAAVRCLVRSVEKFRRRFPELANRVELVEGDVLEPATLQPALKGVEVAYYLVHLMAASGDFEERDREAASWFAEAARDSGVKRIIYLGGLGDESDPKLSPHLRSRHEVGRILATSGAQTIEFRASVVIGNGSLSYRLIRSLTERLPVMLCPKWLSTPTQPIAIEDVVQYLAAALRHRCEGNRIFEIGSENVVTYGQLIREYARQRGLRRWLISVPLLTPYLSGLWLALVTPATYEVGRHLIEGLKNPTVVRDPSALREFAVTPLSVPEAIRRAIAEEQLPAQAAESGDGR